MFCGTINFLSAFCGVYLSFAACVRLNLDEMHILLTSFDVEGFSHIVFSFMFSLSNI